MMLRKHAASRKKNTFPRKALREGLMVVGTAMLIAGCAQKGSMARTSPIPVVTMDVPKLGLKEGGRTQKEGCDVPKDPKPGEPIPECAIERTFLEGDNVMFTRPVEARLEQIQKLYKNLAVRIEPEMDGSRIRGYWVSIERYGGGDEDSLSGEWISYVERGINIHFKAPMYTEVNGLVIPLQFTPDVQNRIRYFRVQNPELSLMLTIKGTELADMQVFPLYSLSPDPQLEGWINYVKTGVMPQFRNP